MSNGLTIKRGFTLISAFSPFAKLRAALPDISFKPQRGFTLIELLIVIAVTGILIGIAIPSLISFNRRQQLATAGVEVKSALRFAQNKASAAEIDETLCPKPQFPNTQKAPRLKGWYAKFSTGSTSYTISGRCAISWSNDIPTGWTDFNQRTFQLPQGLQIGALSQSPVYILFSPVTAPVSYYNNLPNLDSGIPLVGVNEISIPVINQSGAQALVVITQTGGIK